jgi:hypothetical protein
MIKEKGEGHSSIFVFVFHFGSFYHIGRSFYFVVLVWRRNEGLGDFYGKIKKNISTCVCMGRTLRYSFFGI